MLLKSAQQKINKFQIRINQLKHYTKQIINKKQFTET